MNNKYKKTKLCLLITLLTLGSLYIFTSIEVYKSRKELYTARVSFRLKGFCNSILNETYKQYIGSIKNSATETSVGTIRMIASVYFPNIAPQAVSCFIQQKKAWIGYNAKTKVYINIHGVNYSPTWFSQQRELKFSPFSTTLGELDEKYVAATSIEPTKYPSFKFLSLRELIEGVNYMDV